VEPTLTTLAEAAKLLATGGPMVGLLALLWAIHTGRLVTQREHEAQRLSYERELKAANDECGRLRAERDAERTRGNALSDAAAHALDRLAAGGDAHPADR